MDGLPMKNTVSWLLTAALLALSAIPVGAGVLRLSELWGGAQITPENARFFDGAVPAVLHILSSSVFSVVGAFQFVPQFRRRRPNWHRLAGRFLTVCGLTAGLSG